jgi:para-nitrobenzyl esterase
MVKKNEAGATTRFGPVVDGYFLPESPAAIFAAGKQNDVPMLAGLDVEVDRSADEDG